MKHRLQALTSARAAGWLPWSLGVAAGTSILIVLAQSALQERTEHARTILSWALAMLVPALVLAAAPDRVEAGRHTGPSNPSIMAFILACNLGILLLVVPAFLTVWRTDWDLMTGWRAYPFNNKRGLAALYGLSIATVVVFPVLIRRFIADREPLTQPVESESPRARSLGVQAAGLATLLIVVWYLAGPPWNVATHHRGVDYHEQVHLGPLQAIHSGFIPYVGPASTQYGPGSQVFTYAYMQWVGGFDLVGFREAFLVLHLIAFIAIAITAHQYAGFRASLLVLILAVICSPLGFFRFGTDGTPGESFGWGNAARYLGALVVIPALGQLARRSHRPSARTRNLAFALGVMWGVLAWFSQESFSSVVTGGGLLLLLLWATETATVQQLRRVLVPLALGAACLWVPLLGWYASRAAALEFIRNYLLVPRAVAAGYSNTWWSDGLASPWFAAYRCLPVLIVLLAVLTLWDLKSLRLRRPLDRSQTRFLSFVCALAAGYHTVLYRSDAMHVLNVLIALPLVLTLALRDLPVWTCATWPGRAASRIAIVVIAAAVFPLTTQMTDVWNWILYPPQYKYTPPVVAPLQAGHEPLPDGIVFARATARLADEPAVVPGDSNSGSMRAFLEDATRLRQLIGDRHTFVESAAPYYTGLIYFMLDLRPAPYLLDTETMILNNRLQVEAWRHLQDHVQEVECVIAGSLDAVEARMFLAAFPEARVVEHRLGAASVFVILRSDRLRS